MAQTLKEAARLRDQKIAALRSRPSAGWPGQNEAEERADPGRIRERGSQRVAGCVPAGRLAPAWRSTTPDALDDAVRRAIADGDAVIAATGKSTSDGQVLQLLNQISQSARLAVAGPVACASATGAAK